MTGVRAAIGCGMGAGAGGGTKLGAAVAVAAVAKSVGWVGRGTGEPTTTVLALRNSFIPAPASSRP
jgi:hypothetical protein